MIIKKRIRIGMTVFTQTDPCWSGSECPKAGMISRYHPAGGLITMGWHEAGMTIAAHQQLIHTFVTHHNSVQALQSGHGMSKLGSLF